MRIILTDKQRSQLIFLTTAATPALIILVLDLVSALNIGSFTTLGWIILTGNVLSLLLMTRHPELGVVGVFFFSYLHLGLPGEYSGHSLTVLFVLYPMTYLIIHGRWLTFILSCLFYGFMVVLGSEQFVFLRVFLNVALLFFVVLPVGGFMRMASLRSQKDQAELASIERRTVEHLSMAVHDTVLTTLTRELLRVRDLTAQVESPALHSELASLEEGLRSTAQSLRAVFELNESQEAPPDSLELLLQDANLLSRSSKHRVHIDIPDVHLETVISKDHYRFLLLAMREGIVNAAKCAPRHSDITFGIFQSDEGIEASVVSPAPEHLSQDPSLSSGFGLKNLYRRAHLLGVDFYSGPVSGQWVHTVSIPGVETPYGDSGGAHTHDGGRKLDRT